MQKNAQIFSGIIFECLSRNVFFSAEHFSFLHLSKNNWKILILCNNEAPQRREASSLSQGDEDDRNKEKLGNKAGSEGLPGEAYSYLK